MSVYFNPKVGNPQCEKCLWWHPQGYDCTKTLKCEIGKAVLGDTACHSPEHAMPETTPKGERRD